MTRRPEFGETEIGLSILSWMLKPEINDYFVLLDSGKNFEAIQSMVGLSPADRLIIKVVTMLREKNNAHLRKDRKSLG